MAKKYFLGKKLMVLTAHPDDEGLAAGTMYENYKAGGETILVCATAGEKGKSHLAKPVSDAALKKIRRNELLRAAKVLHIDEVIFLGMPDASVRSKEKELYKKTLALVQEAKPDQILSFGPDGVSGHWDHITVGKVALRVAKKLKVPMAAFTISDEMIKVRKKRTELFLARRKFGKYKGIPVHRKGNIKIKIDPQTKLRAMRNHASQFGSAGTPFAAMPKRVRTQMMRYEHFVDEKIVKK